MIPLSMYFWFVLLCLVAMSYLDRTWRVNDSQVLKVNLLLASATHKLYPPFKKEQLQEYGH